MKRYERDAEPLGFGVPIPILLVIWLVCAVIAGAIWQNLASTTPGANSLSASAAIVLGGSFGFAGAGLVCLAVDIVRRA